MEKENKDLNPIEEQAVQQNQKTKVIIGVLVVAIVAIGILIFFNIRSSNENKLKEEALNTAYIQLDSISNELDERILTISQLGGEIDTLLKIKDQLESEKKDLLDREKRRQRTIRDLQDKVDGYQELLLAKDAEIDQLRQINEQLLSENTGLKVEKQELNKSIREINQEKSQLQEKVQLAARLRIEGMKIFAVNSNGKEREFEFRNRHIDQLKIEFTVGENEVAPIEGKELMIRVTDPDGNQIFDVTKGSGSFMFENRELFYTVKKEILYDKNSQKVVAFYDKGSDYAVGEHKVEVYTDDYLMGSSSFIIK